MPIAFDIHVVIATHGRAELLERTLDSLADAERPDDLACVWVVENGSDAGARDVCARFDRIPLRYVHLPQPGRSRAMQAAIERIGRGLVIFTDDDVRFCNRWLTAYADAAAAHGPGAFYGGPLDIDYEQAPAEWLRGQLPPSVVGWSHDASGAPIDKPCFLGANYAAFAERLLEIGGFDLTLGVGSRGNPVGEEFDMQQRMLDAGMAGLYVPEARLWHYVPRSRCSPAWALERHERIWYTNGLVKANSQSAGVERWMWRRLGSYAMKAAAARFIADPERRFEMRKPYRQWKGYMRGLRDRAADRTQET